MTTYAPIVVICDWPECYVKIDTRKTKMADARKNASEQGWTRAAGMDFCGKLEQAEKYSQDGDTWQGHAARTDHRPVIKPGKVGYVKLSCLCGWTYKSPYYWTENDECPRSLIDLRWKAHVVDAEKSETEG